MAEDNAIIKAWTDAACEERKEFLHFLNDAYSLDTLAKSYHYHCGKEEGKGE